MLSLFMMVMLSLVVLEIHEARPLVAMWIVGMALLLRWHSSWSSSIEAGIGARSSESRRTLTVQEVSGSDPTA